MTKIVDIFSFGLVFNSLAEQLSNHSSNMLVTRASLVKSLESVISRNNCARKIAESIQFALVLLNLSHSFEKLGSAKPIK